MNARAMIRRGYLPLVAVCDIDAFLTGETPTGAGSTLGSSIALSDGNGRSTGAVFVTGHGLEGYPSGNGGGWGTMYGGSSGGGYGYGISIGDRHGQGYYDSGITF